MANFSRAHDKRLGGLGCVRVLTLLDLLIVRPSFFALRVMIVLVSMGGCCYEQQGAGAWYKSLPYSFSHGEGVLEVGVYE